MQIITANKASHDILNQAAELHQDSLGYRSFITLFGPDFLRQIYEGVLDEGGFLVQALDGHTLKGFILTITDRTKILHIIRKNPFSFVPSVIKGLLRRPRIIKNILETLFYSSGEKGTGAELMIMAVSKDERSKGLGRQMLKCMEEALIARKHNSYVLTVHQEMADSIRFYETNGLTLIKTFKLYGHVWCVYSKNIRTS
jgi:GNAT superfamily N-acetyltransferase